LQQKVLLAQAWCLLGWYRLALIVLPFKRLTSGLQHHAAAGLPAVLQSKQYEQAQTIGALVAVAGRVTPWKSRCLVQVLVTQRLLTAHGIPGQFCLGVRKGTEDDTDPAGLAAHAWLQCGSAIVNGASGHEQYTVISVFSWSGAPG